MSELKTRFIDDTYVEYFNTGKHELAQIYIKSEADKVIAELEESHKMKVEQLLMEIVKLKEERRWRKCSEEMPKLQEGVSEIFLVVVENESNTSSKGSYVTIAELCDGEWYNDVTGNEIEWNIEDSDYFYRSKVTQWMPLPLEPKEGE